MVKNGTEPPRDREGEKNVAVYVQELSSICWNWVSNNNHIKL